MHATFDSFRSDFICKMATQNNKFLHPDIDFVDLSVRTWTSFELGFLAGRLRPSRRAGRSDFYTMVKKFIHLSQELLLIKSFSLIPLLISKNAYAVQAPFLFSKNYPLMHANLFVNDF